MIFFTVKSRIINDNNLYHKDKYGSDYTAKVKYRERPTFAAMPDFVCLRCKTVPDSDCTQLFNTKTQQSF